MAFNCNPPTFEQVRVTIILLLFLLFVSWAISVTVITYGPSDLKFHVTEASLTKFNLTGNSTLSYKLQAKIASRNPNKKVIVRYRVITANARYKSTKFASLNLTSFDQGHKNTTFINLQFEGKSVINLKPKQLGEYNEETRLGIYHHLAIDLDFTIKYKFGIHKTSRFNPPIVHCSPLSLSLTSNGNSSSPPSFHVTKCDHGFFFTKRGKHRADNPL